MLRDTFGISEYVNADTIAEGLSAFAPENVAFEAGRVMLGRLKGLASERKSFAFETTLASRFYAGWLKDLQADGYRVSLIFLWLRDVEIAVERVRARVRMGGHSIPVETIRRRFKRGQTNLFDLYLPIADAWQVYNAGTEPGTEIARCDGTFGEVILNERLWQQIKQ